MGGLPGITLSARARSTRCTPGPMRRWRLCARWGKARLHYCVNWWKKGILHPIYYIISQPGNRIHCAKKKRTIKQNKATFQLWPALAGTPHVLVYESSASIMGRSGQVDGVRVKSFVCWVRPPFVSGWGSENSETTSRGQHVMTYCASEDDQRAEEEEAQSTHLFLGRKNNHFDCLQSTSSLWV